MNKLHKTLLAAGSAGVLAASPAAHAIPLTIASATFTPGAGYGVDSPPSGENGGTLLDVRFSTAGFAAELFTLNAVGDFHSFDLGTISFLETDQGNGGNAGIRSHETDNLGVALNFTFADPSGLTALLAALGTATPGLISDAAADFILTWTPTTLDLASGHRIGIALENLSFSSNGSQTQRATVTLLRAPAVVSANAVPEPLTLSLVGLGMVGIAATRRRASARKPAPAKIG